MKTKYIKFEVEVINSSNELLKQQQDMIEKFFNELKAAATHGGRNPYIDYR